MARLLAALPLLSPRLEEPIVREEDALDLSRIRGQAQVLEHLPQSSPRPCSLRHGGVVVEHEEQRLHELPCSTPHRVAGATMPHGTMCRTHRMCDGRITSVRCVCDGWIKNLHTNQAQAGEAASVPGSRPGSASNWNGLVRVRAWFVIVSESPLGPAGESDPREVKAPCRPGCAWRKRVW